MSLCYLLCAGEGTRLRPHTLQLPKPRIPFLTMPLGYYGFYLARKGGFQNFLMNKHHLPDHIETLASDLRKFADQVDTIDETQKLLGSGGALWNARDILSQHDYFMIANGDEVLIPQDDSVLKQLLEKAQQTEALCTLLTCDHPELLKTLKAVWVNQQGEVRGFGMDAPEPNLTPVHYPGYKVFSKRVFDWLPEGESNIFYEVLTEAIKQGEKIQTLHIGETTWHETGNFDSFVKASYQVATYNWEAVQERRKFFGLSPLHKINNQQNLLVCETEAQLKHLPQVQGLAVLGKKAWVDTEFPLQNIIASHPIEGESNTMVLGDNTNG